MLFLFPDSTGKSIQTKDKNVAQCPIDLCIHQDKNSASTWKMLNKYVLKDDGMNYYTGRTMVLKFWDLKTVTVSGHYWWLEFWESHFSRAQENKWVGIVKCIEKWFIFSLDSVIGTQIKIENSTGIFPSVGVSCLIHSNNDKASTSPPITWSKCVLREMMHSITFVSKHSHVMVRMTV